MSTQTHFYVQNMKCDGCITRANQTMENIPGFDSAEFDLQQQTAIVTGDIDPQSICQVLADAGYPATVKSV